MSENGDSKFDADVVVVGSGFGGAVAALRFAELGEKVVVLERGDWVSRDKHEVDLDALWNPKRHRFGANDLQGRGRHIVPWVGAAVGGGSHVYAATLKRATAFEGFPAPIRDDDMSRYYEVAEDMMDPEPYPDYPPYNEVRATQLLFGVGKALEKSAPEVVEEIGPINLAMAFAPDGGEPGATFVNKHGSTQRYSDPDEQSLLGGDIDAKNSLDHNYLFVAKKHGADIRALCDVDKVEPLDGGGYRLHYTKYRVETSGWRQFGRKWLRFSPADEVGSLTAKRVVLGAGCVGSTEILLRNRDVHKTLPDLSPTLGERYTSNGDFISLILPFRGIVIGWLAFIAAIVGLFLGPNWWVVWAGATAYYGTMAISRRPFDPDIGTTNSDFIRFRGADGSSQGSYIESGRYPTPIRFAIAVLLSSIGLWRPRRYRRIIAFTNALRWIVPPFELLARSWPIPLLKMGRDEALGTFRLDDDGRAVIDFEIEKNRDFYIYLDNLGRRVAKAAKAYWIPNVMFKLTKKLEIPHNQGGVPMGESRSSGVVDHAGRVFGYSNLLVLDGSIMPTSPGPNPALTILALAERAMEQVAEQVKSGEPIEADEPDQQVSASA